MLQGSTGALATKLVSAGAAPTPVKPDWLYTGLQVSLGGLADLAAVLARVARVPSALVVRGRMRAGLVQPFRRTHRGAEANLVPAEHSWILLDLDKFLPGLAPADLIKDLPGYAAQARAALGPAWEPAQCWYQATSSAGVKPGCRLRLGFWLSRPVSDGQAKLLDFGVPVDLALFSPSQPHFVAAPVFEGQPDPWAGLSRVGFLPGQPEVILDQGRRAAALEALGKATKRLAKLSEGERRTQLNATAFHLAEQFGAELPSAAAKDALLQAGLESGLDSSEAAATVQAALDDGLAQHGLDRDGWRGGLARAKEGAVLPTHGNTTLYLKHHPELASLAWDTRLGQPVWLRPPPWRSKAGPVQDADAALAVLWFQDRAWLQIREGWVASSIPAVAGLNRVDRLAQYLAELPPWDATPRLDTFFVRHWQVQDTQLARAQSRAWFIQAYRRAGATLEHPVQADYLLVLQGAQGLRKSTGLAALVPSPEWFSDGLGDIRDKDARLHVSRTWLVELAELTQRKADQDAFKAFLSAKTDRFRPPYGRAEIELPRRCCFVATTNADQYLTDPTGSRRFWSLQVQGQADPAAITLERDQLWAEAKARAELGELAYLAPGLEADSALLNEDRQDDDQLQAIQDQLSLALDAQAGAGYQPWQLGPGRRPRALTLGQAVALVQLPARSAWLVSAALKRLGWHRVRRGGRRERFWVHPEGLTQEGQHAQTN